MFFNAGNFPVFGFLFLWPAMFPLCRTDADTCGMSKIFRLVAKGHRVPNFLIYETEVDTFFDCAYFCLSQWPKCKSINFQEKEIQSKCQLNSQTRSNKADGLVSDASFNYFEEFPVRIGDVNIIFQGTYHLQNVKTRRLLLQTGGGLTGERGSEGGVTSANFLSAADRDYYNRAKWRIKNQGEGHYIFENTKTSRYLYADGDEVLQGDCGYEEGVEDAPLCLGSDANYENRALWRIIDNGDGRYLIRNVVNYRYLLCLGETSAKNEGSFGEYSKRCVMADANYDDRAFWKIIQS